MRSAQSVMDAFADPTSDQVARTIRKMRWSRGLTQQEMADRLDISLLEMEYMKSGYCRVTEETLRAIAHLFELAIPAA